MARVHAFVFCWPGQLENAERIRQALVGAAERVTVIDSSGTFMAHPPEGWLSIDSEAYYGHQFREALARFDGDVMLQIQADVQSDRWREIVRICRERHEKFPQLAVWSPEIDYTAWPTTRVGVYDMPGTELTGVAQTDCIVWSLNAGAVSFLRTLDYSRNNFGWGIDWAVIAYAYATGQLVVRDSAVSVVHPKGSGYRHDSARGEMIAFLQQLPLNMAILCRLLLKASYADEYV